MYTLDAYLAMIADDRRTTAYLAAMRAVIRTGDIVLELGTGFGYFAVQAARLGAAHVYAVEPEDAVALGPALAAANGVADRITFLPRHAAHVTLPQRASVLVEDLRGASPLFGRRLVTLLDARTRLLEPDARVIPLRDALQVTPACAPTPRDGDATALAPESHGVRLDSVLAHADGGLRRVRTSDVAVHAQPVTWAVLEYATFRSLHASGTVHCTVTTPGRFAGLLSTFEAHLAPGVTYTTDARDSRMTYDAGWLPLAQPVSVEPGDEIGIRIRATHDGADYIWAWDTTVRAHDARFPEIVQRQSTLGHALHSPERLRRRATTHVPSPTEAGALRLAALSLVDGSRTVEEIAATLRARFPTHLPDAHGAVRWTAEWLAGVEESDAP